MYPVRSLGLRSGAPLPPPTPALALLVLAATATGGLIVADAVLAAGVDAGIDTVAVLLMEALLITVLVVLTAI